MARNMPCNRDVLGMAKKTFPKNIGETWDGGHEWDTQLAENAPVVIKQTWIGFMTASGDTPSHLDFLELRTGKLCLEPLPALSFVHSFSALCLLRFFSVKIWTVPSQSHIRSPVMVQDPDVWNKGEYHIPKGPGFPRFHSHNWDTPEDNWATRSLHTWRLHQPRQGDRRRSGTSGKRREGDIAVGFSIFISARSQWTN